MLTWRKIKERIEAMSDEELDDNVTIYDSEQDEFFPAKLLKAVGKSENEPELAEMVLDEGQTYLLF